MTRFGVTDTLPTESLDLSLFHFSFISRPFHAKTITCRPAFGGTSRGRAAVRLAHKKEILMAAIVCMTALAVAGMISKEPHTSLACVVSCAVVWYAVGLD